MFQLFKLECKAKFCYSSARRHVGGGVEEAARARLLSAGTKFKEFSPILHIIVLTLYCRVLKKVQH